MDRFSRPFLACGFGLFLAATGCRSTQQEVPPGRLQQPKQAIQFSSEGHPATAQGSAPYMQPNIGGTDLASGIAGGAKPDGSGYGAPQAGYGPPGSVGTANPNANLTDPSAVRASSPGSIPLTGTPPAGTPPLNLPPMSPASGIPSGAPSGMPSATPNASEAPGAGNLPDLNVTLPLETPSIPNPASLPPIETPGAMGSPGQLPNPN
jgi:hypothetical protein